MEANLLRALNQRPIAYYPIYRQITGSTTAGILLSQLMYWFSKKDKFYKTDAEIMEETQLTEKEFRNAKLKIKGLAFITVTREGIPAKTYYEIDFDMYETSLAEWADTVSPNGQNCNSQKGGTITKTTTKTTTKSKKNKEKKEDPNYPEAVNEWIEYRKEIKKKLSDRSIQSLLKKYNIDPTAFKRMVDHSIENGYQGLFEPKNAPKPSGGYQTKRERVGSLIDETLAKYDDGNDTIEGEIINE